MIYLYSSLIHLLIGVVVTATFARFKIADYGSMGYPADKNDYTIGVMIWPVVIVWVILRSFGSLVMKLTRGDRS